MFTEENWFTSSLPVAEVVFGLLGRDTVGYNGSGEYSAHPVWRFGYPPGFDISRFVTQLRDRLDALGWQIVTTGENVVDRHEREWRCLVVAPLLAETADTVYHVTPVRVIPAILRTGLLPGDESRSLTRFPDTFGKIHGSTRLNSPPGHGDGATFWVRHFTERYREPFGIVAADLIGLPEGARVYRDTHSHWGVVIDRVERIDPQHLREVGGDELSPGQSAA